LEAFSGDQPSSVCKFSAESTSLARPALEL
jgi:hypothetical protein